jgi:hypothetical protein
MVSSRDKARSELKKFSRRPPTDDEFNIIINELQFEKNDKSVALLAASVLDDVLQEALRTFFRDLNSTEFSNLFDPDMPLGSFSAKARIAYAMRLCERRDTKNLDCIREVRNAFAHSIKPVSFNTPEISKVCSYLRPAEAETDLGRTQRWPARILYVATVSELVLKFMRARITNLKARLKSPEESEPEPEP